MMSMHHKVSDHKEKQDDNTKPGSLKKQLAWMLGLWLSGVIALYLFVKISKAIMTYVGFGG